MDPAEIQRLYLAHGAALTLFARQWCHSPDDAVQEAFIDLNNCHSPPACPQAWLYAVTRRKSQNLRRAEERRHKHQTLAEQNSRTQTSPAGWFAPSHGNELSAEDVTAALAELPVEQREIIVARIWGDLSFDQLATLFDCSLSSAHRRYSTAVLALKHRMQVPHAPR